MSMGTKRGAGIARSLEERPQRARTMILKEEMPADWWALEYDWFCK